MTSRACLVDRCPNDAVFRGRCREHARSNDRAIRRKGRSIYSRKRWRILRRRKLTMTPVCEYVDPDEGPCLATATDVHHRHGVDVDPWAIDGLESLCHRHHSFITRRDQLPDL